MSTTRKPGPQGAADRLSETIDTIAAPANAPGTDVLSAIERLGMTAIDAFDIYAANSNWMCSLFEAIRLLSATPSPSRLGLIENLARIGEHLALDLSSISESNARDAAEAYASLRATKEPRA